jgi:cytochrome c oxidase assembly protein subunit 15
MVQWRPLSFLPPLTDQDWQQAFSLYQTSPEFQKLNAQMDLTGFQSIFWLEYIHRLVGRLTGLVFAVPLIVFWIKGAITRALIQRLGIILGLGALQGLVGWLMVASGLVDQPQVSPYRLALHLLMALGIYSALIWTVLDLSYPNKKSGPIRAALFCLALVFVTIGWGALVAGHHAGLVCDTFPLMYGQIFPDGGLDLEPIWINVFENPITLQFTHRVLAFSTLVSLTGFWIYFGRIEFAPPALWSWVQGSLGAATILFHVPVSTAVLHQGGAVILLTLVLRMVHKMLK